MPSYRKGVASERELAKILDGAGFSVMRAPSSGGSKYPLDILAAKNGSMLAFEIKSWNRKPYLERAQTDVFRRWCERAGARGFLGWRSRGRWAFLPLEHVVAGNYGDDMWVGIETFTCPDGTPTS